MNHDSSLQVGRTWRSGPITNPPTRSSEVPVKSASVANFTLQGQSCEQLRAQNSRFQNSLLSLRPPWMTSPPPFKKFKCSIFFSGQISGVLLFRFLWVFLLHCLFSALTLLTAQILFWLQIFCEALSGWVAFLKNKNESLAYSAFIIPSPAAF